MPVNGEKQTVEVPGPWRIARQAAYRRSPRGPRWYGALKVGLDFVLALTLLVFAAPVLLVAAVLVKLTSRGPALYWQTRLGLNGRPYTIYKLRSMRQDAERNGGPCWCKRGDPRVTPVGRVLRRLHIDELPQLWNVLKGEMSLVGPRPERPEFVPELEQAIPRYRERLRVRPGLTGLAQVQLPPDTDLASVRTKLAHDLYYVQRMSAWLDVRLLVCTVFHVLHLPNCLTRLLVPGGAQIRKAFEDPPPDPRPAPTPTVEPVYT